MNAPIKVDLARRNCGCVTTTFVGMNPPSNYTDTLLTLQRGRGADAEYIVTITLFNGCNEIGSYIINHQYVKFPGGLEMNIVIKAAVLVADTTKHLIEVALAELLAYNSTLTIENDSGAVTVHLKSELLGVDILDDVPTRYLSNFIRYRK